ncbi:MAG: FG-GAP repeat protein, partial [Myxococcota bacterium]|nr:FG-GAP repeat protein [Myxococcota bacterium]
ATGDFNGDGLPDLAVTALLDESSGAYDAGAVYLFSGISSHLNSDMADANSLADAHIQGNYERGYLGNSLCATPDANGNGTEDLFVAEPGGSDGVGMLWLLDGQSIWTATSPDPAALLGWYGNNSSDGLRIARSTGDIDGDGITDVVVHQSGYDDGNGRVVVLLSSDW